MTEVKRCRFTVHGRVQGVGYRQFAVHAARAEAVSGWVRNELDGTVCGEVEGSTAGVEAFLDRLRQGPRWGKVARLDSADIDARGGAGFDVLV